MSESVAIAVHTSPLMAEVLASSLGQVGCVISVRPATAARSVAFLEWRVVDALVVEGDVAEIERFARASNVLLVQVGESAQPVRMLRDGCWEAVANGATAWETVRDVLASEILGSRGRG